MMQALLHHTVLYCIFFFAPNGRFVLFSAILLLSVFCTRLMRPNKVKNGRGLTRSNGLLSGVV